MRTLLVLAAAALLVLLDGCTQGAETQGAPARTGAAGGVTGPPAPTTDPRRMEAVVRAWSKALNAGDDAAAARLFALPATIVQGDRVDRYADYGALAAWHALLPCSGTIVSLRLEDDRALAVFELGDRAGSTCDAPAGTPAAAEFVFRDGLLVAWRRAPVPDDREQLPDDAVEI